MRICGKCKRFGIGILSLLFLLVCVMPAHAYEVCGYKLTGSWYNDYYYLSCDTETYQGKTVDYAVIASNAVKQWNNAVNSSAGHPLNIQLSRTDNGSATSTRVVFTPLDRGDTGWRGFTYYYVYSIWTGEWSQVNPGFYPDKNYTAGSAVLNLYYVHSNPAWKIQNTMMHEMGHIFGLEHSNVAGSLMVETSASYTSLKIPQSDDIAGVRSIYE